MALYGALREGWNYSVSGGPGPRNNETIFRGSVAVTGSAVVTLSLPVRNVTHAMACIVMATALNSGLDPSLVTVGNYSGNTFTIYVWKPTSNSNPTLIASTHAVTVEWIAFANVGGTGSY